MISIEPKAENPRNNMNEYTKYAEELHERNYSIYNDSDAEQAALQELHDRSYMILDTEDYELLKQEYREEFDRLAHVVSFASLQNSTKTKSIFISKPKPVGVPTIKSVFQDFHKQKHEEEQRRSTIANTVDALLRNAEDNAAIRIFHIEKSSDPMRYCKATGYYDRHTDRFIIQEGSILSFEMAPSLCFTSKHTARKLFISRNCVRINQGFRLKRDVIFSSPSSAASMVTGGSTNGWTAWRDKNNNTLDSIYR